MSDKKTFYITTPIYYPSDNLHIGHAYTTVAADAMTRYKKMRGFDTYFLTGSDEHGQKIQRRAAEAGKQPKEFVDEIIANFKALWDKLEIDYDHFIRTTDDYHIKTCQELFQKIYDQGDIYKSEYSGWYCTSCETFFTELQVGEEHICPDCGKPVEMMKEESYFFKMSKYADRWLQFIEDNPNFIRPESRRNEMVNFVKQGLDDLCISRTTFDWGIPVPFDNKHVIYVWFDALINYYSALKARGDGSLYDKFWPADVHLVGKDIIRFHTIIWPIMLMAAGLPLPKCVLGHGWIMINSDKMSKSKGNVVDPFKLCDKYSVDAIRYFLMREMGYGLDCNYNEELLAVRINNDLANDYGNLLSRTTGMINKFQEGIILAPGEGTEHDQELLDLAKAMPERYGALMDKMEWANALAELWTLVNKANKYIEDAAPWALNKAGEKEKLATVLYNMVEVIRQVTIMVAPVMPGLPQRVWQQLGIADRTDLHTWDSLSWGGMPSGIAINRGEPLFPRIDLDALDDINAEQPASTKEENKADKDAADIEPIRPQCLIDDFEKLDLRVVKVLECEKVPKTDKLLKFKLQLGAEERTVLSGIAQFYTPEELIGKQLILIANLKPAVIRGIESRGMLLSAEKDGKLQLVECPDMPTGSRIV